LKSSKNLNIEDLNTDIAVIGSGGGGLMTAVTAAQKGAKVIVLEKRSSPGGNSVVVEGIFAAESAPQKRQGIDAGRDKLFKMAMDYAHWTINPRLIRAVIDKSADTVQWLEGKGVILDYIIPLYNKQPFPTWHCHPKKAGPFIIKALVKSCNELGVRLLYETPAKRLLLDANGQVNGVLAETAGKKFSITAKSVIIATGGYAGNKKLLKKYYPYCPENIEIGGIPHMGDGILMAIEIGAATEGLGTLLMSGPCFKAAKQTTLVGAISSEPNTVWVNKNGERFVDESLELVTETGNALSRQPDGVSFSLFDELIKKSVCEGGTAKGVFATPPGAKLSKLEKELQLEVAAGTVKISNSIDDIAIWIGVSPEVLKTTVVDYNSFCDQGYDGAFAKDLKYLQPLRTPPYYATMCGRSLLTTIGGIKINYRTEVISMQGKPIPGLYAVGNDAGGWEPETYDMALAGFAQGFALNSGRIAGENAANYSLVK